MEQLHELIKYLKDNGYAHLKVNPDLLIGIIEYSASKQETKQCDIPVVMQNKFVKYFKLYKKVKADLDHYVNMRGSSFGIGVGTLAGYQIGTSILPVLEITEQGVRVTPPMTLRLNWNILLLTYLILATIAVITTLWLSWITNKMDIQSVLRIGDN